MQREGRSRCDSDKSIWRRNTKCNILFVSFCLGLCRCFQVGIKDLQELQHRAEFIKPLCKQPLQGSSPTPPFLSGSCWTDVQRCRARGAALPGEIIHP